MSAADGVRWSLRPDLDIVRADSMDGRPAILVHDPVSGTFDRVEWPESDIIELLRRPVSAGELLAAFTAMNPLHPTGEEMASYLTELGRRGWLRGGAFWPRAYRERQRGGLVALMARLLFVQIPLLRPEKFLRATAGAVSWLFNRVTVFLLLLCGLAGLYLTLPRWEDYWRDSFGSFALAKLPAFMLALIVVKAAHEFSHAYVATIAGARVPTMGVAFFFFMPLPYTDVTDAWRLSWPRRFRVAVAGMAAEVTLAGVALLLWALSPPGPAAMALARLSSLAIISTLLTNLNPGPRFDGYYVLVCLFRSENLRPRSMAELRRVLWRRFFGIALPDMEAGAGRRRRLAMVVYAVYAMLYRISLGIGIAAMAYYFLPKAIGLPFAAAELWLFMGAPVAWEFARLRTQGGKMRLTLALVLFLLFLAAMGVWAVGSWPRRINFPAVTRSSVEDAVRTLRSGETASIAARRGERVAEGEVLATLESAMDKPLQRRAEWSLREAEMAEEQAWRSDPSRRDTATRAAEIKRRQVELDALRQRGEYLTVHAPTSGTLSAWDQYVKPGVSVARGQLLGWITDGPVSILSCYPDMETAGRITVGAEVKFFPDDGSGPVKGVVLRIDESRPELLEDPALAGALGAMPSGGSLLLPRPYAKVIVRLDESAPRIGQTGMVWMWSKPESLFDRAVLWLRGLAVRESVF